MKPKTEAKPNKPKSPSVTTKEGISIRKVKHFPSMEYGDQGGTSCEILLNGRKIADYVDYGNGGEANIDYLEPDRRAEYDSLFSDAIIRLEPGQVKKYGENIVRYCAVSSVVNFLTDAKTELKACLIWKSKGYDHIVNVSYQDGFQTASLGIRLPPGEKPESRNSMFHPSYMKCRKSLADYLKVDESNPALEFKVLCEEDFGSL